MFPPKWQFNVIVENATSHDIALDPDAARPCSSTAADGFERVEGTLTPSLLTVPAGGSVEGLMVFQAQRSADGRVLSLVYGTGPKALRFEFPLQDLVTAVPPPAPTDAGTVPSAPS